MKAPSFIAFNNHFVITTVMATDKQLAAQQPLDLVPGTEVMTNVGGAHYATAGGKEGGLV